MVINELFPWLILIYHPKETVLYCQEDFTIISFVTLTVTLSNSGAPKWVDWGTFKCQCL